MEAARRVGRVVVWKSDAAMRVVILVGGFPVVALRLPQAIRVSSPFQAPIRPRYAGLIIVGSRLLHGSSPTVGRGFDVGNSDAAMRGSLFNR